ncbi:MAG TPA: DUF1553 domain-containing protein [Fimbriimonadaceae bacterium]|nr:DUF1553 domain-containing protein [Fimbriimonadaceae bacterium]
MRHQALSLALSAATLIAASATTQTPQTKREVIFGRDVRPILSQHCFKCHGPDAATLAAGLRLDTFESATEHGAIVPGKPENSLLIKRVSATDPDLRMPPSDSGSKPLTPDEIATLRAWIAQGAHYEKHWSFVPPVMPKLPPVSNPGWCNNLIDRFVLYQLDKSDLRPEPESDKETLAQRAALALIGLPPSKDLLSNFLLDKRPDAYERYVDKLLALPEYGEHQARYWLDAVRYGDTHGLQLDNERGIYPYRDWVVRAFNQDLPLNKFIEWQLAGDLMPNPTQEQLVATGYVRMNLTSNEGGAIEEEFLARNTFDRLETTGTVMLGLTIGCARCHDHKNDPISQKEYYGLYAYFNSTADNPLDGNITFPPPVIFAPSPEQQRSLTALNQVIEDTVRSVDLKQASAQLRSLRSTIVGSPNWEISETFTRTSFDTAFDQDDKPTTWKPFALEIGKSYASVVGKDNASVYLRARVTLSKASKLQFAISSDDGLKVWVNGKLVHANKVTRGLDPVDTVSADFKLGENEILLKVTNGGAPDGVNVRSLDTRGVQAQQVLEAYDKEPGSPLAQRKLKEAYLSSDTTSSEQLRYQQALSKRTALQAEIPQSLIAQELPKPRPAHILKRGLYDQMGEEVGRSVPRALGAVTRPSPPNRLGLAKWLTSPANPLVARVYVNRLWQQHFGTGLVKTSEDFGNQGEWPINMPLLDYLSVSLTKNNWSLKRLHRLAVTSSAFRQSSRTSQAKIAKDPENRLASRGPRFRLDAEVIRDKALYAGHLLVREVGGRGVKPYQPAGIWETSTDPASGTFAYKQDSGSSLYRRSLYMFWKRTAPPPSMTTFDAPLRDTCVVRRPITNTPLQALTLQNDPTFLEAARTMAAVVISRYQSKDRRLLEAVSIALGRQPRKNERQILTKALDSFLQQYRKDPDAARKLVAVGESPPSPSLDPVEHAAWMLICSTLMNTDEFLTLH